MTRHYLLNNPPVRRRPRELPQLAWVNPAHAAGAGRPRRAAQVVAVEGVNRHAEMRVCVLDHRELIAHADIFLQAYRPGGLDARGFSPSEVAHMRPGIIYVSLSAYGHIGPWAARRGNTQPILRFVRNSKGVLVTRSWLAIALLFQGAARSEVIRFDHAAQGSLPAGWS